MLNILLHTQYTASKHTLCKMNNYNIDTNFCTASTTEVS